VPAGERGEDGAYPEGTVNRRVDERLAAFAEKARSFGRAAPGAAPADAAKAAEAAEDKEPRP